MQCPTLFATPEAVESFVRGNFHKTGVKLRFPEVLAMMEPLGLLSPEPLPYPTINGSMDKASFTRAFTHVPFHAGAILYNSTTYITKAIVDEAQLFPQTKDVYCIQHLPYMNEDAHTHTYFEITYIYAGRCKMLFGGETVEMCEGDLCIVPPNSPHAQPLEPGCLAIGLMVRGSTFDSQFGDLLIKDDLTSQFFRNSLYGSQRANYLRLHADPENEQLRWYLQTLVGECYRNDPHANTCAISVFKLFMAQALRAYGNTVTVYRPSGRAQKVDCAQVLQYIQNNYRSVTLSELAKVFHYNETYLSRMLQSYTNRSFTEIVRTLRLQRAEEYLLNSDMKIREITLLVGYDSVDHFSRTFKAAYGCSPVEFRKNNVKHRIGAEQMEDERKNSRL